MPSIAAGSKAQVATTTIGFGEGFDEDLLQAIADASAGSSYYCAGADDAPGVFAQEFDDLATIVGQNLSVEIVVTDDVKFVAVLNDYPMVEVPGGVQVQVGDIYGGERRLIVFQLLTPGVAELGVKRIAELVVRYVETGEKIAQHQISVPVTVNLVSADEAAASEADHEVVEQVVILEAARARKEARDLADQGDYGTASAMLAQHHARLLDIGSPSALIEAAELGLHVENMSPDAYSPAVRKRMTSETYRTMRSRRDREK